MSDQHDGDLDDGFEAGLLDDDGDAALLPAVGLPALAGRIEGVHGTLSTLGMRLDALVSSTTSYRSTLTDRLNEYSELVSRLTRAQATDLEEYRRANERTVTELRRSLANSEQSLDRVAAQLEEITAQSGSGDDQTRKLLAEVRSILDAQDRLASSLDETLEQFAVGVTEKQGEAQRELVSSLESIRSAVASNQAATDALTEKVAAPQVRATIDELRNDVQSLRRSILEWPDLMTVKEQLAEARTDLSDVLQRVVADGGRSSGLGDQLQSIQARLDSAAPAEALDAGLAGLAAKIDALEFKMIELDPAPTIATGFDRTDSKLATIDQKLDGLDPAAALAAGFDSSAASLRTLEQRLVELTEEVASSGQVTAQTWGELAGIRSELEQAAHPADALAPLQSEIVAMRQRLDTLVSTDELGTHRDAVIEALADVASGEVVASLWDELFSLRSALEGRDDETTSVLADDVAAMRVALEAIPSTNEDLDEIRRSIEALVGAVDPTDVPPPPPPTGWDAPGDDIDDDIDEFSAAPPPPPPPLPTAGTVSLAAIAADLRGLRVDIDRSAGEQTIGRLVAELEELRADLGDGLAVEPSETLSSALESLQTKLEELTDSIAAFGESALGGDESDTVDDESGQDAGSVLLDEMRTMRETVQSLLDRIDIDDDWDDDDDIPPPPPPPPGGLTDDEADDEGAFGDEADDDDEIPPPPPPPPGSGGSAGMPADIADELAALREHLGEELESLREAIGAAGGDADPADLRDHLDEVRADLAEATSAIRLLMEEGVAVDDVGAVPPGGIDQTVLDGLVTEIRTAGGVADDLVDQLRQELTAIRRRVSVRGKDEAFTDDQVLQLADAIEQRQAAIVEEIAALRDAMTSRTALTDEQLEQIADTIAARFEIAED